MKTEQSWAIDWEHRAEDVRSYGAISIGHRPNEIDERLFDIFHGKRPACPIAIESGVQHARRDISANSPDGELSLEPLPSRSAGDRRSGRLGFPLDLHQEWRSEVHTSELQSLMRISYAVFSLKNKQHSHLIQE